MSSRSHTSFKARSRTRLAVLGAILGLTGGLLGAVPAASATADDPLPKINLDVKGGTATIKKLDASVKVGAGKIAGQITKVDPEAGVAEFTAQINLPPAEGKFNIFGVIPTTATVSFSQVAPAKGTLKDGKITARAEVSIQLKDVKAVGFPLFVGDNCRTKTPASITLVSAPDYDIFVGGDISGTFAIPEFTDCGLSTVMLNLLIPGPDNGITLTLGPWVPEVS
ncbi:hypothetical protein [Amycolatopsis anabasis]|uniref:hypothetical protein n=1 Tax=Amycolatopsis anabasis TaxID=1840409 RepID=UPI00131B554D|nr:hypothetical protein [Amycolatopsis anabasis]